ncbi:hypothetical protein Tco_0030141 [Tanacetum coccineum]
MKKDPKTPLLVGRGFLATASAVIDCRKAKIAVGKGITSSVFGVKEIDIGGEEVPYWTTLGRRKSYGPRLSTNGIGAQTPFYARKYFLNHYLLEEWELARDVELNPFKDILVFRKMVEFLGTTPINLKGKLDITQEKETFNPLEIGIDLFSYESPACLEFEQRSRSYGNPNPQDEIAKPISFSPDRT